MVRRLLMATALITALACYVTWPQCLHMSTQVAHHDDAFFSMWRLGWIAHALRIDPRHLYDANIFYPEPRTLAYSDAVILEGAVSAPLQWAGLSPVLVYNVMLLAGFVTSGVAMFLLVFYLTRREDAALVAAAIFTMAPYRIDHFMHLELQWTCWIPLAFLAVHRAFDKRSVASGVLAGVLVWFQLLSSVYYGIFLGITVAALTVLIVLFDRRRALDPRALGGLLAGGVIAAVLAMASSRPYIENARVLGVRPADQVALFSASVQSYFASPKENWWWGWTEAWSPGDEQHLFIGVVAIALVVAGLLPRRTSRTSIYGLLALLAIDLSFGMNSGLYRLLHDHVFILQGLRATARFGIVATAALSVVAGFGFMELQARWRGRGYASLLVIILVLLSVEYGSAPLDLETVPTGVPEVYQLLRKLPRGAVAELPLAMSKSVPGYDNMFMFASMSHWYPLINGYSGFFSPRYTAMLDRLENFPDENALAQMCAIPVRYVIVHSIRYSESEYRQLLARIAPVSALMPLGQYRDLYGRAAMFELHCSR